MSLFQIVLSIHILFAIIWVGGVLFVGWGVYPVATKLSLNAQRQFLHDLLSWTHHLFTLTGMIVILTGIILGTILGPIHTWDTLFSTTYGHIWLTALIIATITLAWGVFIGNRHAFSIISNDDLWKLAAQGDDQLLRKAFRKTTLVESVEVIGFISLIICMVLI
ncbi:MAG TPA: hypothetical protein VK142_05660 [Bacillota bacterium]|nr:hypothetical protein [Bacillota bacterium]